MESHEGNNLAVGDCVSIRFDSTYFIESITSTSPDIGGNDIILMEGFGTDVAVGGMSRDAINCSGGFNILAGDSAEILFYPAELALDPPQDRDEGYFWRVPMSIETTACELGGKDLLSGGNGTDYCVGGAFGDEIHSNEGPDLVFGDHAKVFLYEDPPFKLLNATTTNASCSPGVDDIDLGEGNDIAFGGALGDTIRGGAGQDVILGDFGVWRDGEEFLRNQFFESIIDEYEHAGADTLYGGPGDDILMGQEYGAWLPLFPLGRLPRRSPFSRLFCFPLLCFR